MIFVMMSRKAQGSTNKPNAPGTGREKRQHRRVWKKTKSFWAEGTDRSSATVVSKKI